MQSKVKQSELKLSEAKVGAEIKAVSERCPERTRGCQGLRGKASAAAAAQKRWGRLQSLLAALPI